MIQMVTVMPSKGNKQLLNKFFKDDDVAAHYTVALFFDGELVKLLKEPAGPLATAMVFLRAGDNLPIEVSSIDDNIRDYIEMEINPRSDAIRQKRYLRWKARRAFRPPSCTWFEHLLILNRYTQKYGSVERATCTW